MIIGCNCLMKWIGNLVTWLDCWIGFLWTCDIYMLLVYQVHERDEGKFPSSLQLQNLCSVTTVYPIDRLGGPVDRPHCIKCKAPDENTVAPFFTYNCRSTGPWPGRLGTWDVNRIPSVGCRLAKGQVYRVNYGVPFLKGPFLPYLNGLRRDFGYHF